MLIAVLWGPKQACRSHAQRQRKLLHALPLLSAALAVQCLVTFEDYPVAGPDAGTGAAGGAAGAGGGSGAEAGASGAGGAGGAAGAPNRDCAIAAGYGHTCVRTKNREVWCWGNNDAGQIQTPTPDGGNATLLEPVQVHADAIAVAVGGQHTCVVASDGSVSCQGSNSHDQLGSEQSGPGPFVGVATGMIDVVAGARHTCALSTTGDVLCWGDNSLAQVDAQLGPIVSTPSLVLDSVSQISAGDAHNCARTQALTVSCWGQNNSLQLGDPSTATTAHTLALTATLQVSAGRDYSCARSADTLWCWGNNSFGKLGNGLKTTTDAPVVVGKLLGSDVVTIDAGGDHTCALAVGGQVYCWGSNVYGMLGADAGTEQALPVPVATAAPLMSLSVGENHNCGHAADGTIYCWGLNNTGQLGDSTQDSKDVPTAALQRCF